MENKYSNFDKSMQSLKEIENKFKNLGNLEDIKLETVMQLREEALKHHKICNDILKDIKEILK